MPSSKAHFAYLKMVFEEVCPYETCQPSHCPAFLPCNTFTDRIPSERHVPANTPSLVRPQERSRTGCSARSRGDFALLDFVRDASQRGPECRPLGTHGDAASRR